MVKKLFAVFLLLVCVPMLFAAGTTGKIAGVVTDKETGEPLPGVNVVVEGTYLGSATDLDGYYVILNVPVGTFNLKALYVGYQEIILKGVTVSVDLTTEANFALEQTTLELSEAIVVTAQAERIRKDETNTNIISTAEDIAVMPVRGIQEIASLTAGVVKQDNSDLMNIRGGRDTESAVYIDGVLANDPYNKAVRVYLPNEAIEQMSVQTGGFNAEYGEAMSGIIITTTKSGTEKYSGSVQAITDDFLSKTNKEFGLGTYSYGYNEYNASLSGPVIPGYKHTFHVAGTYRYKADHTPSWGWAENPNKPDEFKGGRIPGNQAKQLAFTAKTKFSLTQKMDLKGSLTWTDRTFSGIDPLWVFNTAHAPENYTEHRSFNVTFTHAPTATIFYNVKVNYFHTFRKIYDRYFEDDLYAYGDPTKNPHVPAGSYEAGNLWNSRLPELDFFAYGNQYDDYFKNQTDYLGADFDLTWQADKNHTFKAGAGYKYHTMREYRLLYPVELANPATTSEIERYRAADAQFYGYDLYGKETDEGDYFSLTRNASGEPTDGYQKQEPYHPIIIHAFLQDKIEFDDLILNLGLRYDQIDPNAWQFRDQAVEFNPDGSIKDGTGMFHGDETFDKDDIVDSEVHHFFSPRLGVSFPVTENTIFHAQYGKFYQTPRLSDLYLSPFYLDSWVSRGGYFTAIDNPNLKPPKTTSYEIGFKQLLGNYASLRLTAFYKETEDLVQILPVQTDVTNVAFFSNGDFGVVKGMDILINLRRYKNVAVNFNYEMQFASGTGSSFDTNFDIAWQRAGSGNYPKLIQPLDFEQRHSGTLNVDYRLGKDKGPELWGIRPFENAGANVLFSFNSGNPYTRMQVYNAFPFSGRYDNDGLSETPLSGIMSETTPWNYRLDLKLDRRVDLSIGNVITSFTGYVYVYNLLNAENVIEVFHTTGLPNSTGFLNTTAGKDYWNRITEEQKQQYSLRSWDFNNWGIPRQIRVGLKMHF